MPPKKNTTPSSSTNPTQPNPSSNLGIENPTQPPMTETLAEDIETLTTAPVVPPHGGDATAETTTEIDEPPPLENIEPHALLQALKIQPKREKETGLSAVQCPMLTNTNYTAWAIKMELLLQIHEVWDTIDPGSENMSKNRMAKALIYQSIPECLLLQIGIQGKARDVWESIRTLNMGAEQMREARIQNLNMEFDNLGMKEDDKIDDFVRKMSEINTKSMLLGHVIDNAKMVKKLLKCVPSNFDQMVGSFEQWVDPNKVSFHEVVGRLKLFEERLASRRGKVVENQTKLMWVGGADSDRVGSESGGSGLSWATGSGVGSGSGRGFGPRELGARRVEPRERRESWRKSGF